MAGSRSAQRAEHGDLVGETVDLLAGLSARFDDDASYARDPVRWGETKLNRHYTAQQRALMASVVEHRYTAVKSAHELGKTLGVADLAAWWIDSHPIGEAFVVTTAPSAAQVAIVMWREIGKTHRVAELPGRILSAGYPQWKINGETVGVGRKPGDYEESAFQGIHARYVLVIIDEACGVAVQLYNAIDSIIANENSRVVAIGNPDDPTSHFALKVCTPKSGWNVLRFDGLRSANMTRDIVIGDNPAKPAYPLTAALMASEGIEFNSETTPFGLREVLLHPTWVEEKITMWAGVPADTAEVYEGEALEKFVARRCAQSALFEAKIRGVFPTAASEGVIPLGWVELAMARWRDWRDAGMRTDAVLNPTRAVLGVDVARFGQDDTVLARRYGSGVLPLLRMPMSDIVDTAEACLPFLREPHAMAVIDVVGMGSGVYDLLRRWKKTAGPDGSMLVDPTVSLLPFTANANSKRSDMSAGTLKFRDDRSAAWWRLRELLDPSKSHRLMLPDDEDLKAELVAPKYTAFVGGVLKVESKDEIKKRLHRSTDAADAVVQAFWVEGLSMKDAQVIAYKDDPRRERVAYAGAPDFSDVFSMPGEGQQSVAPGVTYPATIHDGSYAGAAASSDWQRYGLDDVSLDSPWDI